MEDFKKGDLVEIIANKTSHGHGIGETVMIVEVVTSHGCYKTDGGSFVDKNEIRPAGYFENLIKSNARLLEALEALHKEIMSRFANYADMSSPLMEIMQNADKAINAAKGE